MADHDTGTHNAATVPSDPSTAGGGTQGPEIDLHDPIIDLTDPEGTWNRVEKDLNPFERLDKPNRMRLMIRVLCELVAAGELDEDGNPIPKPEATADEERDADEADDEPVPAPGPIGERRTARSMAERSSGS